MITRLHVNQHVIKRNRLSGDRRPPLTAKSGKNGGTNTYASEFTIAGPCRVIYSPDKPLPCGATVWIETTSEVESLNT